MWKVGDKVQLRPDQVGSMPSRFLHAGDEALVFTVQTVRGGLVAVTRPDGTWMGRPNNVDWWDERFQAVDDVPPARTPASKVDRYYKRIDCLVAALHNQACWHHAEWPKHLVASEDYQRAMILHALGRTYGQGTASMDGLRAAIREVEDRNSSLMQAARVVAAAKLESLIRDHECWEHSNWRDPLAIGTPEKRAYQIGVALKLIDTPETFPDSEYGAIRAAVRGVESGEVFGSKDRCAYCGGCGSEGKPVTLARMGTTDIRRHGSCLAGLYMSASLPWPLPEFPGVAESWSREDAMRGVLRARKILRDKARSCVDHAQPAAVVLPPVTKPARCTVHDCAHRVEDERDGRAMCSLHAVKYDAWLGEQHANGIKSEVEPRAARSGEPRILNNADVSANPWNRK